MEKTMRSPLVAASALAAALLIAAAPLRAEKLVFSPTTTDLSVGHAAHSSLPKYMRCWESEGLDVDVVGIQGATAGMQQIAAKNITFANVGPEVLMMARAKGAKVKAIYTYSRSTIYRAVALKSARLTRTEDLRGKTMGVIAMSTGALPYGKQMLQAAGINPETDVQWLPIGEGAQAALALKRGDAAAWFAWDTAVAALEAQGLEFVHLKPPYFDDLIGNVIVAHEDYLAGNRAAAAKVLRCIAKATLFGLANPEKTIKVHWQYYPATRPEGDEAEAMKKARIVFDSRFGGYQVPAGVKWGENLASQWQGVARLMQAEKLLPADYDVAGSYTNELIDAVNDFDQQAVIAAAKADK
jgi:NitT/TauT family transport system substrate-binding protein